MIEHHSGTLNNFMCRVHSKNEGVIFTPFWSS